MPRSRGSPTAMRSRACPTGCSFWSAWTWRSPRRGRGRPPPGRGPPARPRRLQGRERRDGPRGRGCAPRRGGRAPAERDARVGHGGADWAATSSPCSSTPSAREADAVRVAERIVAALAEPFPLEAGEARIGVSIGIARGTAAAADARAVAGASGSARAESPRRRDGARACGDGAARGGHRDVSGQGRWRGTGGRVRRRDGARRARIANGGRRRARGGHRKAPPRTCAARGGEQAAPGDVRVTRCTYGSRTDHVRMRTKASMGRCPRSCRRRLQGSRGLAQRSFGRGAAFCDRPSVDGRGDFGSSVGTQVLDVGFVAGLPVSRRTAGRRLAFADGLITISVVGRRWATAAGERGVPPGRGDPERRPRPPVTDKRVVGRDAARGATRRAGQFTNTV